MSFYQKITQLSEGIIPKHILFKYGFNISPMYRRSTAKVSAVAPDLSRIDIKLPLVLKTAIT